MGFWSFVRKDGSLIMSGSANRLYKNPSTSLCSVGPPKFNSSTPILLDGDVDDDEVGRVAAPSRVCLWRETEAGKRLTSWKLVVKTCNETINPNQRGHIGCGQVYYEGSRRIGSVFVR
mmetsp:Transcript_23411/g.48725  ORF Transcript_23411/g.48725 Transcript_23411/m.48725 type:complete len:118 (-) Transcript_23411:36-389(-)